MFLENKTDNIVLYFFNKEKVSSKAKNKYNIVRNTRLVKNELKNQLKLINVVKSKEHFFLCENIHEIQISESEIHSENIDYQEYKYSDDTILLEVDGRQLTNFYDCLSNSFSPNKYLLNIIYFYKHLLRSIDLLVDSNIFCNNIKASNILIDSQERPLIRGFSFSIDLSNENMLSYLKHFILEYKPSYIEWPIELHILSFMITNEINGLSYINIENIINDVLSNDIILKRFDDTLVSSYKNEAVEYFKKYINKDITYVLNDVLRFSNTWDNYALSILFLRILIYINGNIRVKNKFIILFMKLLLSARHYNPCIRITSNNCGILFEKLLDDTDPNVYKDIINSLASS